MRTYVPRWFKELRRPVLRVESPRIGTSLIPLNSDDNDLFFQYLTNKFHSLHFDGTDRQLTNIIESLKQSQGFSIQKMSTFMHKGSQVMHIHLRTIDSREIRRVIRLS